VNISEISTQGKKQRLKSQQKWILLAIINHDNVKQEERNTIKIEGNLIDNKLSQRGRSMKTINETLGEISKPLVVNFIYIYIYIYILSIAEKQ